MKLALCILVLAMNCAGCVCQAAPAKQQRPAQNTGKSEQHTAHRPLGKQPSHSPRVVPKPKAAQHTQRAAQRSSAASGIRSQRRPGAESQVAHGSAHGATPAAIQARPARVSSVNHNTVPAASTVRHHNANAAAIGGSKSTTVRSAAALNGTRMGARH